MSEAEELNLITDETDAGIGKELRETGIHEPKSSVYLKSILNPNWNVLEIGANIGYYAKIEAEVCKKVVCFEPVKNNFKFLKINLKSYSNTELYNLGMSYSSGEQYIYLSEMGNRHTIIPTKDKKVKIQVTTIDNFISKNPQHFHFIRMDVEGAEAFILEGGKELFLNDPPAWLFIEFHPIELGKIDKTIIDLLETLKAYGYNVEKVFYENSFKKIRLNSFKIVWNNFLASKNKLDYLKGILLNGRSELEFNNVKDYVNCSVFNVRASEVFLKHESIA